MFPKSRLESRLSGFSLMRYLLDYSTPGSIDLVQITQGPPISSKRGSGKAGSIIEVAGRIIAPAIAYRPGTVDPGAGHNNRSALNPGLGSDKLPVLSGNGESFQRSTSSRHQSFSNT